ncbi:hypothetical protein CONPUDRAFT_73747 [Coniophora puteana RWD-64-598 SS2]|uniref:Uncharacterized protein n=1 Tax=Coniophora puteana (strain RWD-64-598) TaxID=741705 RepID=A0A5M3MNR3_CONPW|nr:uncharacterized protein CONPUDRAFT_73747 [Coniophora puteana RWD-64-598 SS2]EIW80677.1 hypothetical protein CONPUDRAFT_73747 [Coniophora puteana RWD-64-598 SS2]
MAPDNATLWSRVSRAVGRQINSCGGGARGSWTSAVEQARQALPQVPAIPRERFATEPLAAPMNGGNLRIAPAPMLTYGTAAALLQRRRPPTVASGGALPPSSEVVGRRDVGNLAPAGLGFLRGRRQVTAPLPSAGGDDMEGVQASGSTVGTVPVYMGIEGPIDGAYPDAAVDANTIFSGLTSPRAAWCRGSNLTYDTEREFRDAPLNPSGGTDTGPSPNVGAGHDWPPDFNINGHPPRVRMPFREYRDALLGDLMRAPPGSATSSLVDNLALTVLDNVMSRFLPDDPHEAARLIADILESSRHIVEDNFPNLRVNRDEHARYQRRDVCQALKVLQLYLYFAAGRG